MAETRKLAAILAADVAGYSKLAGSDEERTLARPRALRSDLIDRAPLCTTDVWSSARVTAFSLSFGASSMPFAAPLRCRTA
jgi:adenylate cyclase